MRPCTEPEGTLTVVPCTEQTMRCPAGPRGNGGEATRGAVHGTRTDCAAGPYSDRGPSVLRGRTQNGRVSSRRCHTPNRQRGAERGCRERAAKLLPGACTKRGVKCATGPYTHRRPSCSEAVHATGAQAHCGAKHGTRAAVRGGTVHKTGEADVRRLHARNG